MSVGERIFHKANRVGAQALQGISCIGKSMGSNRLEDASGKSALRPSPLRKDDGYDAPNYLSLIILSGRLKNLALWLDKGSPPGQTRIRYDGTFYRK
jgi:hypothetical protein